LLDIFGVVEDISMNGYIIRTFFVFLLVSILGRYLLKRAVTQLTSYDFVYNWILGALTVAPLLSGKISFLYTIVPLATLFFWHLLISIVSKHNKTISHFFNGKPAILISNGEVIRKNLKRHFINADILLSELRLKQVFDIASVEYVILEPNGHISILKKNNKAAIAPPDINLNAPSSDMPEMLIKDGKLQMDILLKHGLSEEWLRNNLTSYNIQNYKDAYIVTINSSNELFVLKNNYSS